MIRLPLHMLACWPPNWNRKKPSADQAIALMKASDLSDPKHQLAADLQMGKILLAADDPKNAAVQFGKILNNSTTSDMAQQYQARYFQCICELNQEDFDATQTALADLATWQAQHLADSDSKTKAGAAAATAILQYRIETTRADRSNSVEEKRKFDHSAVGALENLVQQQPGLKPTVLHHLGLRYADATDIDHADPLTLEAIMQRGASTNAEASAFSLAGRAAGIVVNRSSEFAPATVDYAAALSAAVLDRNGQNGEAARAYVALYAKRLQGHDLKTAAQRIDRAIELFQTLPPTSVNRPEYEQGVGFCDCTAFQSTKSFVRPVRVTDTAR